MRLSQWLCVLRPYLSRVEDLASSSVVHLLKGKGFVSGSNYWFKASAVILPRICEFKSQSESCTFILESSLVLCAHHSEVLLTLMLFTLSVIISLNSSNRLHWNSLHRSITTSSACNRIQKSLLNHYCVSLAWDIVLKSLVTLSPPPHPPQKNSYFKVTANWN